MGNKRVCHYCKLVIRDDESAVEAKTRNAWAHFTCWYEGAPFEREVREKRERMILQWRWKRYKGKREAAS